MKYNNGDIYNGTWKNNQKCKGIMKYKNGNIYEGEWLNDNQRNNEIK